MSTLKRRRNIYRNAGQLVQLAVQKGYTYEKIADICDVSLGSVQRWLSTNRADASKIKALEDEIGQTYLSAESVGDAIIELYNIRKMRFRLKRFQLKKISGRTTLRWAFIDQLSQYLLDRGYYMLESVDNDDDIFIIIKHGQLLKHVKHYLENNEIKTYYKELAEEMDYDIES